LCLAKVNIARPVFVMEYILKKWQNRYMVAQKITQCFYIFC